MEALVRGVSAASHSGVSTGRRTFLSSSMMSSSSMRRSSAPCRTFPLAALDPILCRGQAQESGRRPRAPPAPRTHEHGGHERSGPARSPPPSPPRGSLAGCGSSHPITDQINKRPPPSTQQNSPFPPALRYVSVSTPPTSIVLLPRGGAVP